MERAVRYRNCLRMSLLTMVNVMHMQSASIFIYTRHPGSDVDGPVV